MDNIISKFHEKLLVFLFQSLLEFKRNYDYGEEIFKELFFKRNEASEIDFAFNTKDNITIVGNPGEGKTCLMHYMFLHTKLKKDIYPIILDYRNLKPKNIFGIIYEFISCMKNYFIEIKAPINTISEKTTQENYQLHFNLISEHFDNIDFNHILGTKRLAIFLDDLDYMDSDYINILKEYFVSYSRNDRSTVILSGRKPLINSICIDDELRQAYKIRVKPIYLGNIDLKLILHSRLNSIYSESTEFERFDKTIIFKTKKKIIKLLRKYAIREGLIEEEADGNLEANDDAFKIDLEFNDLFYNYLYEITGKNLRSIEEILPTIFACQNTYRHSKANFNTDFCDSFIKCVHMPNYLLDLVSEKSKNKKKKFNGNSIIQIVLEYFYENETKDVGFYSTVNDFGITNEEADRALTLLSGCPFSMLDPEYIYAKGGITVHERYKINRKGRMYVTNIINRKSYYERLKTKASARRLVLKHVKLS